MNNLLWQLQTLKSFYMLVFLVFFAKDRFVNSSDGSFRGLFFSNPRMVKCAECFFIFDESIVAVNRCLENVADFQRLVQQFLTPFVFAPYSRTEM